MLMNVSERQRGGKVDSLLTLKEKRTSMDVRV